MGSRIPARPVSTASPISGSPMEDGPYSERGLLERNSGSLRLRSSGPTPPKARADGDVEKVKVFARIRPALREDEAPGALVWSEEDGQLTIFRPDAPVPQSDFVFDKILGPSSSQADVYSVAVSDVVADVLRGYNGTILAYGQTGAGKTYTLGNTAPDAIGMVPRAAAELFSAAARDSVHMYRITMSYIQIYMEMIQDLLNPTADNLPIREDGNGVFVAGACEVPVASLEECLHYLELGEQNRVFAFTHLNAHSSRSHAVVMLTAVKSRKYLTDEERAQAEAPDQDGVVTQKVTVGKLYMVDLAGSERLKKSKSVGLRATEARSINLSLTMLGMCISARAQDSPHVPFRDSKLTRLLQESLGGNAKTSLILCLSDVRQHADESLQSLQFGSRAACVRNKPVVNERLQMRQLTAELLAALEEGHERVDGLEAALTQTKEERDSLQAALAREKARSAAIADALRDESKAKDAQTAAKLAEQAELLSEHVQQLGHVQQQQGQLEMEVARLREAARVREEAHRAEVSGLQERLEAVQAAAAEERVALEAAARSQHSQLVAAAQKQAAALLARLAQERAAARDQAASIHLALTRLQRALGELAAGPVPAEEGAAASAAEPYLGGSVAVRSLGSSGGMGGGSEGGQDGGAAAAAAAMRPQWIAGLAAAAAAAVSRRTMSAGGSSGGGDNGGSSAVQLIQEALGLTAAGAEEEPEAAAAAAAGSGPMGPAAALQLQLQLEGAEAGRDKALHDAANNTGTAGYFAGGWHDRSSHSAPGAHASQLLPQQHATAAAGRDRLSSTSMKLSTGNMEDIDAALAAAREDLLADLNAVQLARCGSGSGVDRNHPSASVVAKVYGSSSVQDVAAAAVAGTRPQLSPRSSGRASASGVAGGSYAADYASAAAAAGPVSPGRQPMSYCKLHGGDAAAALQNPRPANGLLPAPKNEGPFNVSGSSSNNGRSPPPAQWLAAAAQAANVVLLPVSNGWTVRRGINSSGGGGGGQFAGGSLCDEASGQSSASVSMPCPPAVGAMAHSNSTTTDSRSHSLSSPCMDDSGRMVTAAASPSPTSRDMSAQPAVPAAAAVAAAAAAASARETTRLCSGILNLNPAFDAVDSDCLKTGDHIMAGVRLNGGMARAASSGGASLSSLAAASAAGASDGGVESGSNRRPAAWQPTAAGAEGQTQGSSLPPQSPLYAGIQVQLNALMDMAGALRKAKFELEARAARQASELARRRDEQVQMEADANGQLQATRGTLAVAELQLASTAQELEATHRILDETVQELGQTRRELDERGAALDETREKLDETAGLYIDATRLLDETRLQLESSRTEGQRLESELERAEAELSSEQASLRSTLAASARSMVASTQALAARHELQRQVRAANAIKRWYKLHKLKQLKGQMAAKEQELLEADKAVLQREALQAARAGQALVQESVGAIQDAVGSILAAFVGRRYELEARKSLHDRLNKVLPAGAGPQAGAAAGSARSQLTVRPPPGGAGGGGIPSGGSASAVPLTLTPAASRHRSAPLSLMLSAVTLTRTPPSQRWPAGGSVGVSAAAGSAGNDGGPVSGAPQQQQRQQQQQRATGPLSMRSLEGADASGAEETRGSRGGGGDGSGAGGDSGSGAGNVVGGAGGSDAGNGASGSGRGGSAGGSGAGNAVSAGADGDADGDTGVSNRVSEGNSGNGDNGDGGGGSAGSAVSRRASEGNGQDSNAGRGEGAGRDDEGGGGCGVGGADAGHTNGVVRGGSGEGSGGGA